MSDSQSLHKSLGLLHVFAIASGAMVGSGLFILPGMAHAMAGPGVILSYVLAGLLATTGMLSMVELATAMPKAGSDYFIITRGFGAGIGSIAGMLSWFSLSLKSAFAIVGMATFARMLLPFPGLLTGVVLAVLFVGLNILGVHQAARAQTIMVIGLYALLLLYVAVGFSHTRVELFTPFAPRGATGIFFAAGFVFISYGGLLKVASVAEEIRDPGRVMPLGLTLALLAVTVLYALTVMVTSGIMDSAQLDGSLTPISDGGRILLGEFGLAAMSIAAVLALVSTANAGIMAASRYLLAMSRDGLVPPVLSKLNTRFKTPHTAISLTGGLVLLSLFLPLKLLVEAASCVLMLTYVLCCLSVIVLRESGLENYRPLFKAPLYPWLQVAGILGIGFVLAELGIEAFVISATLVLTAFLVFWFYGRKQYARESALLHLITRLTDYELVEGELETELKEIIRERDHIVVDRFDRLVRRAPLLDLSGPLTQEEFFDAAAERLAPRLGMARARLAEDLHRKEQRNSTVLSPFIASPYVAIEGSERFEMLVARVREGIDFGPEAEAVRAAFVFAGTADERSFHFRALAAIAQVAMVEDFEHRWLEAKDEQGLRDLILLAERKRFSVK